MQKAAVTEAWGEMDYSQRLVYNKLITGAFRVGVSQQLVVRALVAAVGASRSISSRIVRWANGNRRRSFSRLSSNPSSRRRNADRAAVSFSSRSSDRFPTRRSGRTFPIGRPSGNGTASGPGHKTGRRGLHLVARRRPDDRAISRDRKRRSEHLPDGTVIDGEILPWADGRVLPFTELQRRIGRKNLSAKILSEMPVILQATIILEYDGRDIRELEFRTRREFLETTLVEFAGRRRRSTPANRGGRGR